MFFICVFLIFTVNQIGARTIKKLLMIDIPGGTVRNTILKGVRDCKVMEGRRNPLIENNQAGSLRGIT